MEIWKLASDISSQLFDIADMLASLKKYKFSEQLNAATMSLTNNIAEGSGSSSNKEFAHFLNITRRSVFECANIISLLQKRDFIDTDKKIEIYVGLNHLSSMLTNFRKSLLK